MIGNGEYISITNSGKIMLIHDSPIELKDILIVPQIKKNLVSISKLTKDFPCSITFVKTSFVIKDLKTQEVLLMGLKKIGFMSSSQKLRNTIST